MYLKPSPLAQVLCGLAALLAFVWLVGYGWKSAHSFNHGDDVQLYLSVRQLRKTGSFYRALDYSAIAAPGQSAIAADRDIPNAYPPHAALFYLPFCLLRWPFAHNVWTVFNMACLLGTGWLLFDLFGTHLPRAARPLWLTALFLSGPPYAVAYYGQTLFPVLLSLLLVWRFLRRGPATAWLAGLLYAVAMVKPTIALPFLLYHLIRRDSRRAALYGLGFTLLFTVAVMAYGNGPVAMFAEYRATLKSLAAPGNMNDVGLTGTGRAYMCNLDVLLFDLLHVFFGGRSDLILVLERILMLLFIVGGTALLVRKALQVNVLTASLSRDPDAGVEVRRMDAAALAWISLFALLALYHRWYDLGLLFLPAIVALDELADARVRQRFRLGLYLSALGLLLFILMRQKFVFALQAHRGWTVDALYYPARLLLLLLWMEAAFRMQSVWRAMPAVESPERDGWPNSMDRSENTRVR